MKQMEVWIIRMDQEKGFKDTYSSLSGETLRHDVAKFGREYVMNLDKVGVEKQEYILPPIRAEPIKEKKQPIAQFQ